MQGELIARCAVRFPAASVCYRKYLMIDELLVNVITPSDATGPKQKDLAALHQINRHTTMWRRRRDKQICAWPKLTYVLRLRRVLASEHALKNNT